MSIQRGRNPVNKSFVALIIVIIGFAGFQLFILHQQMLSDHASAKDELHHLLEIENKEMKDAIKIMTELMTDTLMTIENNQDRSIGDSEEDDDDDEEEEHTEPLPKADSQEDNPSGTNDAELLANPSVNEFLNDNVREEPKSNSGMNIVLLYADDWRFDSIGIVNPIVHTPNLDKLASQGMLFSQNAVTTSICWISRACLATGQHYARHKTINIGGPVPFFDHWNETLFGKLKDNGYYTGMVGKWHAAEPPPDAFNEQNLYYGFHIDASGRHITDMNEAHAIQFLQQTEQQDDPFALFVNFYAPHHHDGQPKQYFPSNATMSLYKDIVIPFAPTATQEAWEALPSFFNDNNEGRIRWRARFDTPSKAQRMIKNYFRLISGVDKTCGKIIEQLEKQNLMDNTMIIFTTDNGYFHAEHGLADKFYAHQESIRVPLIIKDPRMDKKKIGTQNDDFTLSIDLAPTMLKAAGIDVPQRMQGIDMSPLYKPKEKSTSWRDQFYYEYPGIPNNSAHIRVQALVRKDYKYMFWLDEDYEQLFHIPTDRYEQYDLARNFTYKAQLEEMRKAFKAEQSDAQ